MPRQFRDRLPARGEQFAKRNVAPKALGEIAYTDVAAWLRTEPALRLPLLPLWRSRAAADLELPRGGQGRTGAAPRMGTLCRPRGVCAPPGRRGRAPACAGGRAPGGRARPPPLRRPQPRAPAPARENHSEPPRVRPQLSDHRQPGLENPMRLLIQVQSDLPGCLRRRRGRRRQGFLRPAAKQRQGGSAQPRAPDDGKGDGGTHLHQRPDPPAARNADEVHLPAADDAGLFRHRSAGDAGQELPRLHLQGSDPEPDQPARPGGRLGSRHRESLSHPGRQEGVRRRARVGYRARRSTSPARCASRTPPAWPATARSRRRRAR